jgi:hypothetical protein
VALVLVLAGLAFFLDIPPPPPNPAMEMVVLLVDVDVLVIKDGLLWMEVVGAKAVADAAKSAIDAIGYE